MKHLSIGVFGNHGFINELGKKGTENDILIYHHADSSHVFSFVTPNSDKIQSLMQTVNMIDVPLFVVDDLTSDIAEEILAVDSIGFDNGYAIVNDSVRSQYEQIIKGTCLENFKTIGDSIPELFMEFESVDMKEGNEIFIPIDNYFNVKSVGTVVLGFVKSGAIKKFDKLIVQPIGKEVVVKGIQIQDKNMNEAPQGSRVGLNLKGIETTELKRGFILTNSDVNISKTLNGTIEYNKFFKKEIGKGEQFIVSSGLQCVSAIMGETIELERHFVIHEPLIALSTTQEKPRIIGKIKLTNYSGHQ